MSCPHASKNEEYKSPISTLGDSELPSNRQTSSIPKSNDSFWLYPSQRQFQSSLQRKGWKTDDKDIEMLVDIHNFLNEGVWQQICKWEKLAAKSNKVIPSSNPQGPILKRFEGRPSEPTWKARILSAFKITNPPFDRHDWYVQRGEKEIKYVIDYYSAPSSEPDSATFHVDVRPAVNSFSSLGHRIKALFLWKKQSEN